MSLKRSYNGIPAAEMKQFLDEKYLQYNTPAFIDCDPVSIPHTFSSLHDREISGFLTATIAWGRRDLILRSARLLMKLLEEEPYQFVMSAGKKEIEQCNKFVHRTFNGEDCVSFIMGLRYIYSNYNSMEELLIDGIKSGSTIRDGIMNIRKLFFSLPHPSRSEKHFADVGGSSAGKRINMFLRWMVRSDDRGVDFGCWKKINPSLLYMPIDLHSGNTARKLGLLTRKANDWKAVEELTAVLREFDPSDPVKYDYALFGIGINEKF